MIPFSNTDSEEKILLDTEAELLDNKTVSYLYDENTSLEYSLTYTGFKEDIVVTEYTGQTEYQFSLYTNGLKLIEKQNSFYLEDECGEIKANIGDIIIFTADEKNNAYGRMTYETIKENEEYALTIHIDEEYLKDEATKYPIRIDPTIEINYDNNGSGAIEDVTLNSLDTSEGTSGSLFVGKRGVYGVSRVLMRFPELNLYSIPSAECITNATIEIRDLLCESTAMTVYCYVFTGENWTETSVHWSNAKPNSYATYLSANTISYANGVKQAEAHRYKFNITEAVKGWKLGNYSIYKGVIFKADSSIENGSTNLAKTFASYNRSAYKPSLSVTYNATNSSELSDGRYCFNNMHTGKYLRHSLSNVTVSSGTAAQLATTIRWQVNKVSGGYVIRSCDYSNLYLGVPTTKSSSSVQLVTINDSSIPSRCIWSISSSTMGGKVLRNIYNSKYLYNSGTVYGTSDTLGSSGTSLYETRVWRIATPNSIKTSELRDTTEFYKCDIMVGYTSNVLYRKKPSAALWAASSDFVYNGYDTTIIDINSNGYVTAIKEGVTTVTATHRITGYSFEFDVQVWPKRAQLGTLNIWYNAETNTVGFWNDSPNIYMEKLNNDSLFYFYESGNFAVSQWNSVLGMNMESVDNIKNADISVYGGTRDELEERGYIVPTTAAGITYFDRTYKGYYAYAGNSKLGFEMKSAKIYIVSENYSLAEYKHIFTHELGHALGYAGHSAVTSSIMFWDLHSGYNLNTYEKRHLQQLYN